MNDVAASRSCETCGGEITQEQIVQKTAGLVAGVLMCPGCVEAKRKELIAAQQQALQAVNAAPRDITEEKISLVEEEDLEPEKKREAPKITSFAQGSSLGGTHDESHLTRVLAATAEPATRCRTFHSKLTPGALGHMDEQINEFLDSHPDYFVKFATTTVGMFEAKLHPEPHLIITIFY